MNDSHFAREQQGFDAEVQEVAQWFKSDRFKLTKRPYTAADGKRFLETAVMPAVTMSTLSFFWVVSKTNSMVVISCIKKRHIKADLCLERPGQETLGLVAVAQGQQDGFVYVRCS
jgi:hypothetical protein